MQKRKQEITKIVSYVENSGKNSHIAFRGKEAAVSKFILSPFRKRIYLEARKEFVHLVSRFLPLRVNFFFQSDWCKEN